MFVLSFFHFSIILNVFVDDFIQFFFWTVADNCFYYFAVFFDKKCWNTHHTKASWCFWVFIYVHFDDFKCFAAFFLYFF
ncbi:thioredoxin [Listeria monocytogenes]|nr:thioredoxin [Listeria monocytogenes]GAT38454.1 thioredoxin [Listeria monocytogenes]GAT40812.1 thioredoxin [Listeria monocytogenes]